MQDNLFIASRIFDMPPSLLDSYETPPRSIVRVFHNRSTLAGNLRVDAGTFCLDPWRTAMLWKDHMEQRGWQMFQTENGVARHYRGDKLLQATITVAVLMEKVVS